MAKENKEKEGDKKGGGAPPPESGSKISNTEWGMAIFALLIIDLIEIGLDALFGIGAFSNPFIDLLVNMAWATYLYLRGVNLKSAKNLATLLIGGGLQQLPGFDGFWAIEGTVIMFITKFEEKIKEKTGVDVEKMASAAEGGDVGAAAGEAGAAGEAAAEGGAKAEGAAEGEGARSNEESGGMSDEDADAMGQESDAGGQERESDNPYGDESEEEKSERMAGEEGDGGHEISDEDAENEHKKNESQSEGDKDGKDKDKKKKKPEEKQGGRNSLFGRGGRGGNPLDLRNRYRSPEEIAEDERLQRHSDLIGGNLLSVVDREGTENKESEERSHSE